MWYLVTFGTYGSWLPGDPRGFVSRKQGEQIPLPNRYAEPDSESYNPTRYAALHKYVKSVTKDPVFLTARHREIVAMELVASLAKVEISRYIAAVVSQHIHLLFESNTTDISNLLRRLKSCTSHALSGEGLVGKVWARGYNFRKIPRSGVAKAVQYVRSHIREKAVIIEA